MSPRRIKLTQNCVCFTNLCINPFVPTSVTREYHPKVLERPHLLQYFAAYLQETLPWERHNTSVFLEMIFIPAWSHAAENRSNACWRPCCEDPRMQYQFVRKKQTVHPAVPNIETLVDVPVIVYPIHIDQGSSNFLWEDNISYCTTVRGLDILRNVFFSGYVTFQIITFFVNEIFFHYFVAGWNGLEGQISPAGRSAENPDIDYEQEWQQHTPLSESNASAERLWFNSGDTNTIFWTGIGWFNGQHEAPVNIVIPQHPPKLFTRNPAICCISQPWILRCWLCSTNVDHLSGRQVCVFIKIQPHAGSILKGVTCKCFADTLPWWWFCSSKFFLYLCKSHGSTSKCEVSCSKYMWSFSGINTAFFLWSENKLSKGSNSLLQFLRWCELSDFTNCKCKMKCTHNNLNIVK